MGEYTGLFIPPWYVTEAVADRNMNLCCVLLGAELMCAVFAGAKGARQTWSAWKARKHFTAYIFMIWGEWSANFTMALITWFYFRRDVPPSFWFFLGLLILWVVQIHCILQIIVNRVGLIMERRSDVKKLRIMVFLIIAIINISGFIIWIPARLQISETYIHVNSIWDRTEKSVFAVVDFALNCYFIYSVRTKLIAYGLDKYRTLFRINICMAGLSIAMDILLIGAMSIPDGILYVQVHPLVYLVKLQIELNLAELIAAVVRESNPLHSLPSTQTTANSAIFQ